jgi:hypothetical protein
MNGDLFKSAPWWKPVGFSEANLTAEERRVYDVIRFHLGRARAIQADEIAALLDLTTRVVNAVMKSLTENHALAIGASLVRPMGYYLIDTADELENYCRQLHNRALSTLRRESILRRTHMLELLGQIRAELEEEEKIHHEEHEGHEGK